MLNLEQEQATVQGAHKSDATVFMRKNISINTFKPEVRVNINLKIHFLLHRKEDLKPVNALKQKFLLKILIYSAVAQNSAIIYPSQC